MPANLLVLPLLAGYWFVHFCHYFRFRAQRLEGYRLLLESSIAGAFLFLFARVLTHCLLLFNVPFARQLKGSWDNFAPVDFSGTATGAFALGIALPFIVNSFFGREGAKRRAILRHGDDLLRLLDQAAHEERAICLTLQDRRFFVGYVISVPNLMPQESFIALLPIVGGYCDSETLELTTTKSNHFEPDSDPDTFRVTIPLNTVTNGEFL